MNQAVFGSLENLEKNRKKKKLEATAVSKDAKEIEKLKKRVHMLTEHKEKLLQKLEKRTKVVELFKSSDGDLSSLEDEDKDLLLEMEKQRLEQIQTAYRLTGTSMEVVSDKLHRLRFDTSYRGSYYEQFYVEIKNQPDSFSITRHTLPSFIPFEEVKKQLTYGIKEMCGFVHTYLRAYIARRQEAFIVQKEFIDILDTEICSSPSFDYIEVTLKGIEELDVIKLLYEDLTTATPTQIQLLVDEETSDKTTLKKLTVFEKELKSQTLSHVFKKFFADS